MAQDPAKMTPKELKAAIQAEADARTTPQTAQNPALVLPAGTYRLVTEEEEIPGLSFVAFRRTAMMLHLPALSTALATASTTHRVVPIDAVEWSALVEADRRS